MKRGRHLALSILPDREKLENFRIAGNEPLLEISLAAAFPRGKLWFAATGCKWSYKTKLKHLESHRNQHPQPLQQQIGGCAI